jgi:Ni/Co efflux regulator RcnB
MKKFLAVLVASTFAVASASALAADPPKDKVATRASAKLEKPANVTTEAWAKMNDAEKQKAVDAAKGAKSAAAPKKEKKGGC